MAETHVVVAGRLVRKGQHADVAAQGHRGIDVRLQVEDQPFLRGELNVTLTAMSGVQLPAGVLSHLRLGAKT